MKTLDEAIESVCQPDNSELSRALCEAKVHPFFDEAQQNTTVWRMLNWGYCCLLSNLMDDAADDADFQKECGSVLISMLLYGVAIGREMEKVEF